MATKKTLSFLLMDPPFESSRTTTAFRLIDIAARRGHNLKIFCYEGAVGHSFAKQTAHPNKVHGRDAAQESHPLPKDWIAALTKEAENSGGTLEWMNCGLCVDERGVGETIPGIRRGTPGDLWTGSEASDNTLIIPTR